MNTTLGIIFALISMAGFGLSNAISQKPIRKLGPEKVIFWRGIIVGVILTIVLLFFIPQTEFSFKYILIALAISCIGYLPLLAFYQSLKLAKVGAVAPIANSSLVFTVLFASIFFKESLNQEQLLSMLLILIGVVLISINIKDFKSSKLFRLTSGIPYACLACFLWGLVFFLFKIPVNVLGPFLTALLIEVGNILWSGIHLKMSKLDFKLPDKKMWYYLLAVAVGGATGTLFFNLGINVAKVSIVTAITACSPLVAIMAGRIMYGEKLRIQQYVAAGFILIGIIFISYF